MRALPAPKDNSQLDIIFVHAAPNKRIGGIIKAGLSYIEGLLALRHNVEVWTASPILADKARQLGVQTLLDPNLRSVASVLLSARLFGKMIRRAGRADALIHNNGRLWLVAWLLGSRRQFVVFHNDQIGVRGFFRNWLSISEAQRVRLAEVAQNRPWVRGVHRIRNGLSSAVAPVTRAENTHPVTIGFLAEIRPKKGLDILIEAAALLRERGVVFRLAIGGDGPDLSCHKQLAQKRGLSEAIVWHGWVVDTASFYNGIDLFCLPSRVEPFGLVMIEAMARGIPVVATTTDGPREVIASASAGLIVDIGDASGMADALELLIENPEKRRSMGDAGRHFVERDFNKQRIGELIEQAVISAIGR